MTTDRLREGETEREKERRRKKGETFNTESIISVMQIGVRGKGAINLLHVKPT